jgi:hypothetical protein
VFLENSGISGKQVREKAQAQSRIANANPFRILGKNLSGKKNDKTKSRFTSKPLWPKLPDVGHDPRRFPFTWNGGGEYRAWRRKKSSRRIKSSKM